MIDLFIEQIEAAISNLGGTKISKRENCIMSQYLYEFSNGLCLEIFDRNYNSLFEFRFGKLKMLYDKVPRIFVENKIDAYYKTMHKINFLDKKLKVSFNEQKKYVNTLIEMLPIILKNHKIIMMDKSFIKNTKKLDRKLRKYTVIELDPNSIDYEIELCQNNCDGKLIKISLDNILYPVTWGDALIEGIAELLLYFVFFIVGAGFMFLLSKIFNEDVSDLPSEFYILIGFAITFIIALPICIVIFLKKKKD